MEANIAKAIEVLKEHNQNNVLRFFENCNDSAKEKLAQQVLSIDFKQLDELYKKASTKSQFLEKKIEHLDYIDKYKLSEEDRDRYTKLGEDIIKNNQYAVVTMAGGQGTRLGHIGPKGTFELNVKPESKYLFQILAEGLIAANKKYSVTLPWYIMTSTENNYDTVRFFEEHNYFGYNKEYVRFFIQGNLPLVLENGDLIIDKDFSIKLDSDGNGCIYKSMKKDGIIDDMEKRGIKWLFIGAVDNILLNMVDPILLGVTINDKNEIASRSIAKNDPKEKVGVFCSANGVPSVIEYSELPDDMGELRDESGELLYGEAHIMCNLFSLDAIKKIADKNLEYHVAHKKASYMKPNGEFIEAKEPNAYKFEAFIFDAFNYFENISILRGKREDDFAPVKNKEGNDSPETAIELYNKYHNK